MKNIYNLFIYIVLSVFAVNAQTSISDDFETTPSALSWTQSDAFIDTHYSNPHQDSNNPSDYVMYYQDIGGTFANTYFDYQEKFNLSGVHEFSILIYVPSSGLTGNAPNQISLKLQNADLTQPWTTQTEIIKPIVLDLWQVITFDFNSDSYINLDPNSPPPDQRADLNRLLLQVNGENNNDQVTAYIDDFSFTSDADNNPNDPNFNILVWQDEFNYTGAVDSSKWFHQTQLPQGDSWFNGEIQHYTDRIDNAEVSNGTLKIKAKAEVFFDQGVTKFYTSARLNSKYAFTYGKVDIRAKLPTGVGTWPALWTLGQNIDEDGGYWDNQGFGTTSWPACGELDIMEHWGNNQDYISSAIHTPSSFGGTVNTGGRILPNASTEFHTYTMIWTEDYIEFRVDGVTHYTYDPAIKDPSTWPFDAPQYFLFNVAILPEIDGTGFTQSNMEVDYIRVYQEDALGTTQNQIDPEIKVYPNPVKDFLYIDAKNLESYTLYNILGQNLKQGQLNTDQIDLSELEEGLYILRFKSSGNKYISKKIIKI